MMLFVCIYIYIYSLRAYLPLKQTPTHTSTYSPQAYNKYLQLSSMPLQMYPQYQTTYLVFSFFSETIQFGTSASGSLELVEGPGAFGEVKTMCRDLLQICSSTLDLVVLSYGYDVYP